MKVKQSESSGTLAHKIQTENHPKERIQNSQHGETLKSRIKQLVASLCECEMSANKHVKFLQGFLLA